MKTTAKRSFAVLFLVALVIVGLVVLSVRFALYSETWVMMRANEHLTQNGSFIAAGKVTDRNGEVLAYTEDDVRCYNESERIRRSTLHIVGDTEGYISSGIQTAYKNDLVGYNPLTGMYSLVKNGRGNDVVLTIDAQVSAVAYDALNGRNGIVAAYNYETGEVICSVSSPNYDITNKPSAEEINSDKEGKYDGLYINRLIDGMYTPGSTFKIITATCAVENISDIYEWEYECEGETVLGGVKVTCPKGHGVMSFRETLSNSCNCAFATLAVELGGEKLTETANNYGFGSRYAFGNQNTAASIFDVSEAHDGDLAWAGVGQYTTLVNPYHMLTVLGSIANDGEAVLPYTVSKIITPDGKIVKETEAQTVTYIDSGTAREVSELMRFVVTDKYGDDNFKNLSMCGKTGTAEVEDGKEPHSWFVGFSQNSVCPVAIVVVVENGGWGSQNAMPIASQVMADIYKTMA